MVFKDYIPNVNLGEFVYELPKDRIALYPLAKRDNSKLLFCDVLANGITHHSFSHISELLPKNSLLIFNDTKVISARLNFQKPTGGNVEILLIEPLLPSTDPQIVLAQSTECTWKCIIGGKRVREGMELNADRTGIALKAKILKRWENEAEVLFSWDNKKSFAEIISLFGKMPLPPYIKRDTEESDKERYQTVYARFDGSVAAPTAGLHFTDDIIEEIRKKNFQIAQVSLHVGPGTFQPIENEDISEHDMHEEQFFISLKVVESICQALLKKRKIIATGTTSLRTIETLYWLGAKLVLRQENIADNNILNQWEPYLLSSEFELPKPNESFEKLAEMMKIENIENLNFRTKLLIVPGYDFKAINGLITNFHMPKSTLILLVAAFTGKELWKIIYSEALTNDYRFLSYGDSSFLMK